jgi:acyl carrier protein phosphodiesterase
MNFLAHLYMSDDTPAAMVGNLLADFVKGPDVAALPADIQAGIRYHRAVDAFTDRHPLVQRSITRISGRWGWFSGILIDVYYDHILAAEWSRYSPIPLRSFADHAHAAILSLADAVPPEARMYAFRLIESDRLVSYANRDGVEEALVRLSKWIAERIPTRAVALQDAVPDLSAAHAGLADDFHAFFPELIALAGANVAGKKHLL